MRTHPDIGLVIGDLLHLARFWLCNYIGGGGAVRWEAQDKLPPTCLSTGLAIK